MKEQSTIRKKQSINVIYPNITNPEQVKSKSVIIPYPKFSSLTQELKDVRKKLNQVKRERDRLKMELLNCLRII